MILGAAKDPLEAGAKFVLEERQERYQPDESLEALLNRAMKLAGISTRPDDVSSEASKALATINQSVPKIAEAVRKVRNDQGSGHGRTVMATMSMPEAAFIRDLTLSVVNFLLSEHDAHPRW
ncbi:abortive infection family protein [Brevibacterium sp. 1718]|uniref:abortive infection family protein n=1 Tax=Brevibacterium sp. 1718 TaxID=3413510 RepID=UPI003DA7FA69